jgi:hypothetical protein
MKKLRLIVFLIVVLIVLMVGGIVYFWQQIVKDQITLSEQKQTQEAPLVFEQELSKPEESKNSDLQTYVNNENKYSINLPKSWGAFSEYDSSFSADLNSIIGPMIVLGAPESVGEMSILSYKNYTLSQILKDEYVDKNIVDYKTPAGLSAKIVSGFQFADDLKIKKYSLKKVYLFENGDMLYKISIVNDTEIVKSAIDSLKFLD